MLSDARRARAKSFSRGSPSPSPAPQPRAQANAPNAAARRYPSPGVAFGSRSASSAPRRAQDAAEAAERPRDLAASPGRGAATEGARKARLIAGQLRNAQGPARDAEAPSLPTLQHSVSATAQRLAEHTRRDASLAVRAAASPAPTRPATSASRSPEASRRQRSPAPLRGPASRQQQTVSRQQQLARTRPAAAAPTNVSAAIAPAESAPTSPTAAGAAAAVLAVIAAALPAATSQGRASSAVCELEVRAPPTPTPLVETPSKAAYATIAQLDFDAGVIADRLAGRSSQPHFENFEAAATLIASALASAPTDAAVPSFADSPSASLVANPAFAGDAGRVGRPEAILMAAQALRREANELGDAIRAWSKLSGNQEAVASAQRSEESICTVQMEDTDGLSTPPTLLASDGFNRVAAELGKLRNTTPWAEVSSTVSTAMDADQEPRVETFPWSTLPGRSAAPLLVLAEKVCEAAVCLEEAVPPGAGAAGGGGASTFIDAVDDFDNALPMQVACTLLRHKQLVRRLLDPAPCAEARGGAPGAAILSSPLRPRVAQPASVTIADSSFARLSPDRTIAVAWTPSCSPMRGRPVVSAVAASQTPTSVIHAPCVAGAIGIGAAVPRPLQLFQSQLMAGARATLPSRSASPFSVADVRASLPARLARTFAQSSGHVVAAAASRSPTGWATPTPVSRSPSRSCSPSQRSVGKWQAPPNTYSPSPYYTTVCHGISRRFEAQRSASPMRSVFASRDSLAMAVSSLPPAPASAAAPRQLPVPQALPW